MYYNSIGPSLATSSEIYIDCQPVSSSEETVDITNKKTDSKLIKMQNDLHKKLDLYNKVSKLSILLGHITPPLTVASTLKFWADKLKKLQKEEKNRKY